MKEHSRDYVNRHECISVSTGDTKGCPADAVGNHYAVGVYGSNGRVTADKLCLTGRENNVLKRG